ncbi:MAG: hypothetical protein R2932_33365 [Caldilineaceae bacterium]
MIMQSATVQTIPKRATTASWGDLHPLSAGLLGQHVAAHAL